MKRRMFNRFLNWIRRNPADASVVGTSPGSKSGRNELDRETSELWLSVLVSLSNLKNHGMVENSSHIDAMLFHGAQPRHYVRVYKLRAWQWLLYPIHCRSYSRGLKLLVSMPIASPSAQKLALQVDDDLAYIEFAGKSLGPLMRFHVRKEILRNRISPWKIRATFVSMSIVSHGHQIVAHRVSRGIYWPFRIIREVLVALSVWSMVFALADTTRQGCLSCNSLGLMYLSVFLALFGYLAHIGGPERKQAERFLTSMGLLEFQDA